MPFEYLRAEVSWLFHYSLLSRAVVAATFGLFLMVLAQLLTYTQKNYFLQWFSKWYTDNFSVLYSPFTIMMWSSKRPHFLKKIFTKITVFQLVECNQRKNRKTTAGGSSYVNLRSCAKISWTVLRSYLSQVWSIWRYRSWRYQAWHIDIFKVAWKKISNCQAPVM